MIHFHQPHFNNLKGFYCEHVLEHLCSDLPRLVSYTRFVDCIPSALFPPYAYFQRNCLDDCSDVSLTYSTSLDVCVNQRIAPQKVCAGLVGRGKTSTWRFIGFILHLVINDQGEQLTVLLTPGNVDDCKPVPKLVRKRFGKVFGDKGYISQAPYELLRQTFGIHLVTMLRSNAKNRLPMSLADRIFLRKRAIIETVIDQLKNISQIEHSRHRSVTGFVVNLLCGLIAYSRQPKKPSFG